MLNGIVERAGALFGCDFWTCNKKRGFNLYIYDKNGKVHAKVNLSEKHASSLRDSLTRFLTGCENTSKED